jgi:hypothetical protein
MKDARSRAWQKKHLLQLQQALGASQRSSGQATVRRDDCGDYALFGRLGHIYAVPEGFQLMIDGESSRRWNFVKLRLSFSQIANDGDDEGTMFLGRLPAVAEARLIREALGIRRAAVISSDARARKVLDAKALRKRAPTRGSLASRGTVLLTSPPRPRRKKSLTKRASGVVKSANRRPGLPG